MRQRRRTMRALFSATAAATCLALATPAWASMNISINKDHKGATAGTFSNQDCKDERFAGLPAGYDGWHFILPGGKDSGAFETITVSFTNGVTVKIPDANDVYPDAFYPAGQDDARLIHAYLFTPAGWTLADGTATITGEAAKFNLSHTCAGVPTTPTPTPTPTPSPTTPG
ncbi:hypothetical protein GSF22_31455, partial [Micromonospora echinofusca]|nr:hypothetical protein [Micromonospora echinofusca]